MSLRPTFSLVQLIGAVALAGLGYHQYVLSLRDPEAPPMYYDEELIPATMPVTDFCRRHPNVDGADITQPSVGSLYCGDGLASQQMRVRGQISPGEFESIVRDAVATRWTAGWQSFSHKRAELKCTPTEWSFSTIVVSKLENGTRGSQRYKTELMRVTLDPAVGVFHVAIGRE